MACGCAVDTLSGLAESRPDSGFWEYEGVENLWAEREKEGEDNSRASYANEIFATSSLSNRPPHVS